MGRTNMILLAMGVLAMVALSMMMQYVMGVRQERAADPLAQELMQNYGARLEQQPRLIHSGEDGDRHVTVEIHPIVGIQRRPLAMLVGEHVWRGHRQPLVAVRVVCLGLGGEELERFDVARPYSTPAARK